jgi:mannobiose 2-epimerase
MVGFWDAYEQLGMESHGQAAWNSWRYIDRHFVNPAGDDWFKVLDANGIPKPGQVKAGPWECPYHHARACFEMIARLEGKRA